MMFQPDNKIPIRRNNFLRDRLARASVNPTKMAPILSDA